MERSSRVTKSLAPATTIVRALPKNRSLPMDFLSRSLGMVYQEVERNVILLEEAGVVKRTGNYIALVKESSS